MSHWTIRKRLFTGFVAILLLAGCVAGLSVWSMRRSSATFSEFDTVHLPEMALATAFEREILNARIHFIYPRDDSEARRAGVGMETVSKG